MVNEQYLKFPTNDTTRCVGNVGGGRKKVVIQRRKTCESDDDDDDSDLL